MLGLLVFCFLASCRAFGCPDPSTIDDVNVTQYFQGTWYQLYVSKNFEKEFEGSSKFCTTAQYAVQSDGYVMVNNSGRAEVNGPVASAIGKARQVSGGKFEVSFFGPFYGPYWIIGLDGNADTGYRAAVVYSCALLELVEDMWILSRTPTLPHEKVTSLIKLATSKGIDVPSLGLDPTTQKGCGWKGK